MKRTLLITTLVHLGLLVSVAAQRTTSPSPIPTAMEWRYNWVSDTLNDCAHDAWYNTAKITNCGPYEFECLCSTQFGVGKVNNRNKVINNMAILIYGVCEVTKDQALRIINDLCDRVDPQPTVTSSVWVIHPSEVTWAGRTGGGGPGGPSGSSSGGSSEKPTPKLTKAVKSAIGAGSGVGALVVAFIIWLCCRKKKGKDASSENEKAESATSKPGESLSGEDRTAGKGPRISTAEIYPATNRRAGETDLEYQERRLQERREIVERKKRLAEEEEQIAMEEEALRRERAARF